MTTHWALAEAIFLVQDFKKGTTEHAPSTVQDNMWCSILLEIMD